MERLFRSNAIQEVLPLSSLDISAGGIDRGCIEQSEVPSCIILVIYITVLGASYTHHECVVHLDNEITSLKFLHIIQVVQNWPIPYFHSFWSDEHSELWISLLAPIPPSP
jgi:hypothetical protein